MAAHITYEIRAKARTGDVSIQYKALNTPSLEVAEYLIREKYPSAVNVTITIPAAHDYPEPIVDPITAATMAITPIRRSHGKKKAS